LKKKKSLAWANSRKMIPYRPPNGNSIGLKKRRNKKKRKKSNEAAQGLTLQ
jgi:hypothetical protein